MFIGIKLQYSFNIIPILTYCSYQFWVTIMFARSIVTGERWCLGFDCGRTIYVAGIWFGQLFKMISFELCALSSSSNLVLALAGRSFQLIVFSKLACRLFTFISTARLCGFCAQLTWK